MTASQALVAPLKPGDVLAGKYRIEGVLGAGGMGVVVSARHLELDEVVAVKFLHGSTVGDGEATARFLREARAAVKIRSEHVARVIDVGRFENGAPYMVMEYLHGDDLAAVLRKGALAPEDAIDYVLQACDAMVEAHSLGIIHRDLKPANLFLTQRSDGTAQVKVLDFGISKLDPKHAPDAAITKTSAVIGSPFYMSPEQLRSAKDVDERTDIWSLGVILFELLTRQPPFQGDSLPELLAAIMMNEPPPLKQLQPSVPEALETVVLRCLHKDRNARFANVGELVAALAELAPARSRAVIERVSRMARLRGSGPPPTRESNSPSVATIVPNGRTKTDATWSKTRRGEPQSRSLALVLLAVLAAGGGVLALVLVRKPSSQARAASALASASAPAALDSVAPPPPQIVTTVPAAIPSQSASPPLAAPANIVAEPAKASPRARVIASPIAPSRAIGTSATAPAPAPAAPEPVVAALEPAAAPPTSPSSAPKKRSLVIELK